MKRIIYSFLSVISLIFSGNSYCTMFYFINNKTEEYHLDARFIEKLASEFKPDFFLETGTCSGMTARTAAPFFKQVHTVELSPFLYQQYKVKLEQIPHIKTYLDHSAAMIKKIAPTLDGHILFWLDAHYSGGNTVLSSNDIHDPNSDTPIRQELAAIKDAHITNCTILIDDIRGFGSTINNTEYLGWWAYPSIQEVCRLGLEINPHFAFALLGDQLLMYDQTRFTPQFSPVVHACTASRLYDGHNMTDAQLLEHEKIIMNSQGQEREYIARLYQWAQEVRHPLFHHDLWFGLMLMGSHNWHEAEVPLTRVQDRIETITNQNMAVNKHIPYKHWRIEHYLSQINAKISFGKKR